MARPRAAVEPTDGGKRSGWENYSAADFTRVVRANRRSISRRMRMGWAVSSAALRREGTGCATGFRGDVVATAKRDLKAGEVLDGEGGYMVWGRLMPAADSLAAGGLPIGLAHKVALKSPVKAGEIVRWSDVAVDGASEPVRVRREMERLFARSSSVKSAAE